MTDNGHMMTYNGDKPRDRLQDEMRESRAQSRVPVGGKRPQVTSGAF